MFDIPELTIAVASPWAEDVRELLRKTASDDGATDTEILAPNAELLLARVGGKAVG